MPCITVFHKIIHYLAKPLKNYLNEHLPAILLIGFQSNLLVVLLKICFNFKREVRRKDRKLHTSRAKEGKEKDLLDNSSRPSTILCSLIITQVFQTTLPIFCQVLARVCLGNSYTFIFMPSQQLCHLLTLPSLLSTALSSYEVPIDLSHQALSRLS